MSDSASTVYKVFRLVILSIVFLIVAFLFCSVLLSTIVFNSISGSKISADQKRSIAVVELNGVLLESKKTIELLKTAEEDELVKAIIIRINSPGGTVAPAQEIFEEIKRIDKDVKPVYASLATLAASGGYYVASAARKIYASPGTLTGSIGVIAEFVDLSKLYDYIKVSPFSLKAGKYKDIGSSSKVMTAEEKKILQELLSDVHNQFINDILEKRKDVLKEDIKTLAQGQVFTGQMALKYGLIDDVKGLWQAAREIHAELKIEEKFDLYFIKGKSEKGAYLDFIFDSVKENFSDFDFKTMFFGKTDAPVRVEM